MLYKSGYEPASMTILAAERIIDSLIPEQLTQLGLL